ncbi:hypothetical protein Clacol_006725 [Clathrus columnatus]|uniref:Small ribosomal subunit protein mS23 n=1 Tax=Clathrus columnatus TaxID=1419009 RepID=A0AAV5AG53_9AGAM|nr:hypothetical protein Clacol_006725 [Clathrus columnatus]
MRRIASKVHQQAARLINAGLIKTPPWYKAVLDHPPLPLPPRTTFQRTSFDLPKPVKRIETFYLEDSTSARRSKNKNTKHLRPPKALPKPIEYLEDRVRRQFFKDRPFEAFRARTLVEDGAIEEEHTIRGTEWTRLRQIGRNPLPEDAVRFAVHLHTVHQTPLTLAYSQSVRQYDALRSEQHIMTRFALLEARAHGAEFRVGAHRIDSDSPEVERGFEMEQRALESWSEIGGFGTPNAPTANMHATWKRWKVLAEPPRIEGEEWSGGEDYVSRWKKGVRPNYERSQKMIEPLELEEKQPEPTNWQDIPVTSARMYR